MYALERRGSLGADSCQSSSSESSDNASVGEVKTLAQVYWDMWDPAFKEAYILPYCDINTATDFTISNYQLEQVVYGSSNYLKAVEELLTRVPVNKRERCRQNLLRRIQQLIQKRANQPLCAFCRNNGQSPEVYQSHVLRDSAGRVACPILRKYKCPKCGVHGDSAHTLKYCPLNV